MARRFRFSPPSGPAVVTALYLLFALILTYPLALNLTGAVPNDIGDPLLNTWILAWDAHALLTDPLNLFNANIFYPLPNTLAYSEHLFSAALLALPVQLISGEPVLAYNLSLLLSFPLAGLGAYLLGLRWTGRRSAAFIAGFIFAFNPYRFAAIAHLQLLTFQWLPFALLSLDMVLRRRSISPLPAALGARRPAAGPWPLLLAIFLLLQILASWYLALYTALILGLYGLGVLLSGRRPGRTAWGSAAAAGLVVALLATPFVIPYLALLNELQAARPLALALTLAASPADFATAAPFNRLFGPLTAPLRGRPGFTEEHTLFPGLIAPLLALLALFSLIRRSRRSGAARFALRAARPILSVLLLILLLSLALAFPGPYAALANLLPASTVVRAPTRWIIPALFALAGLAAFGWTVANKQPITGPKPDKFPGREQAQPNSTPPRLHPSTLPLLLYLLLLIAETISIPLPLAAVENRASLNPAYTWLAGQPGPIALVELPMYSAPEPEYPEVKRLYASTRGWWGLVNGYSGYTPDRQPALARVLNDFPDQRAVETLQSLAEAGPLYLLVHPDERPLDRAAWEETERWRAARQPALWPVGQFQEDYLYRVAPPERTRFNDPPLATFGPDREIWLLRRAFNGPLVGAGLPGQSPPPPSAQLLLYWQNKAPLDTAYTVFVHLRGPDGTILGQADGPPVSGHYPTTGWPAGQIIQDSHPLPEIGPDQVDHIALGLYDPHTGDRLPAFGPAGEQLPEDAVIIQLPDGKDSEHD